MGWSLRYNDGSTWSGWQTIDAPTNEITISHISTRKTVPLYDGSNGRVIPTTKFKYEPIDLDWSFLSGSSPLLYDGASAGPVLPQGSGLSLYSTIQNGYKLELKTHQLSGVTTETWQGYLKSYPKTYKLGMYKSKGEGFAEFYDLSATFDLMEVT